MMSESSGPNRIVARLRRSCVPLAGAVALAIGLSTVVAATSAYGQDEQLKICGGPDAGPSEQPRPLPNLNAEGTTLQEHMAHVDDVRRYVFQVPRLSTAEIYVGDQWYNLNMGLFSVTERVDVACWGVRREAAGERAQRRIISFIRPDEKLIEDLAPGSYILTVRPAYERPLDGFDPARGFTVRISLIPNVCGLNPPNTAQDPNYPKLKQRENDEVNYYQAGVTYEPAESELGPFALMTFSAHLSPPFNDLFDFEWQIDGQAAGTGPVIQRPYADLPKTSTGVHKVTMTAKGAREYRDPDPQFNHLPLNGGSVKVDCAFRGPA
jgi:hypothetical protein